MGNIYPSIERRMAMEKNEESKTLRKGDLIDRISERFPEMTKKDIERVFDETVGVIKQALQQEETVSILGFAKFAVAIAPEREGTNPATGKKMKIPARKVVRVKVSKKVLGE